MQKFGFTRLLCFTGSMSETNFLKGECASCGGHLEFPAEAAGETVPCPHCGQPTTLAISGAAKKSGRGWILIALAILLAGAGMFVWTQHRGSQNSTVQNNSTATNTATNVSPPPKKPAYEKLTNDLAIYPFGLDKMKGSSLLYVTGMVANVSDRQRFGVKVQFQLLDENSNVVGAANDYQATLPANGQWQFKAMVMSSKTVSAKFDSITEN
jgi:hypothetical protein